MERRFVKRSQASPNETGELALGSGEMSLAFAPVNNLG